MKVFIDGYIFWIQKVGGITSYWSNLLPKMAEIDRSNEFYLYLKPFSIEPSMQKISNIKLLKSKSKLPMKIYNFIENGVMRRYSTKIKPDIFHSTYYTSKQWSKIPKIMTVYDMIYEFFPQYFSDKKSISFIKEKRKVIGEAERIIAISENTKRDLISLYHLPESKIRVVYPGINQKFKRVNNESLLRNFKGKYRIEKPYFLYIGRRLLYKNVINLLKAFSLLPQRENFQLLLIGGEKEFSPLEVDIINRLKINDDVKHIKEMSEADLISAYNSAVALVFPSLYEGFGLPILEAMACGCPVLCSNASSMPEVGGDAAIYFNPNEVDVITNELEKILDENTRKKMGMKGIEKARQYTWEKTANQTLQVYKQAIG